MFDSGISVKNLIKELKETEVDIALDIPTATYVSWLNSLQQLLYSEVVREKRRFELSEWEDGKISISSIEPKENGENPRFEDIYAIYAKRDGYDVQLIKTNLASGSIFPDSFFKDGNDIGINVGDGVTNLTIIYNVRPELIGTDTDENDELTDENVKVMLPVEFIDLAKAKLRGEAYKLANEDNLAAKWLNDYNVHVETFKNWLSGKATNFGI
jgi:hypothetical protein